jgi:hypothetical protein
MVMLIVAAGIGVLFLSMTVLAVTSFTNRRREEDSALMRDQLKYIEKYRFPNGLIEKIAKRRPELTYVQIDQVLEALREYFRICLLARAPGGKAVGMPSRAVDDAWHEFILFTRDYHVFCEAAFGRYLHHTPNSKGASTQAVQDEMLRTWDFANRSPTSTNNLANAGIAAASSVPLLFAIDQMLGITDGQLYTEEDVEEFETQRKKQAELSASDAGFLWFGGIGGDDYSRQLDADFSNDPGASDGGGGDGGAGGDGGGSSCGGGGCGGGGCGGS